MRSFTSIVLLIISGMILSKVQGQANTSPQGISYQGIARNNAGAPISNQSISLRFTIHSLTSNGAIDYSETQQVTTSPLGLFSVFIGKGTATNGTFSLVNWISTQKYLQVEMDASGGTNYIDMGTQQMMSVPFSMFADKAESARFALKAGNAPQSANAFETSYFNGDVWLATSTILNNPASGRILMKGTLALTETPSLSDTRYSLQIETQKPMLMPRMSQSMISALAPVEGMVVFNTDAHKLQVYALITNNTEILNEIFAGTETNSFPFIDQMFTPPISGQVYAVDVMFKDAYPGAFPNFTFFGSGSTSTSQPVSISGSYPNFTWYTIVLNQPFSVVGGSQANFRLDGPGVYERRFATNSYYPNGSGCCFPGADDVLFRIHIQPTPNSYGWQNLN